MEKILTLQQMTDKEHTFSFILVNFVQFMPGTNFVRGSPFSGLSAGDGRKIV